MKLPWTPDDEPKVGHPLPGERADEAPVRGDPGPAPDPSLGSTLPQSSVSGGVLEESASKALDDKNL